MATYAKLPMVITNHALSLQKANQAQDNLQAVYDAMAVDHGVNGSGGQPGMGPPRVVQLGHHSSQRIPRAIIGYRGQSVTPFGTFVVPTLAAGDPHVSSVTRLSAGALFFPVVGLSQFYADPMPRGALVANTAVFCVARSFFGSTSGSAPGLYITTYAVTVGPTFGPADVDFDFALYGIP